MSQRSKGDVWQQCFYCWLHIVFYHQLIQYPVTIVFNWTWSDILGVNNRSTWGYLIDKTFVDFNKRDELSHSVTCVVVKPHSLLFNQFPSSQYPFCSSSYCHTSKDTWSWSHYLRLWTPKIETHLVEKMSHLNYDENKTHQDLEGDSWRLFIKTDKTRDRRNI